MPIDEGVNVDLQFLILEVKKQSSASLSYIQNPTKPKLKKIKSRENYVDNLKKTLENKSYFNLHKEDEKRQVNYFRALITIASNLERCADYFERIASPILRKESPTLSRYRVMNNVHSISSTCLPSRKFDRITSKDSS